MINFQSMPKLYRPSDILQEVCENALPIEGSSTISSMRSEFGQRLFKARKHANLTQVQLCEAIGCSQANYSDLESKGLGSALTPAIAKRCGVSVDWLAYGEGDMLIVPGHTRKADPFGGLTPGAIELASLFDMIPVKDQLRRIKAWNAASAAIVEVVESLPANVKQSASLKKQPS